MLLHNKNLPSNSEKKLDFINYRSWYLREIWIKNIIFILRSSELANLDIHRAYAKEKVLIMYLVDV